MLNEMAEQFHEAAVKKGFYNLEGALKDVLPGYDSITLPTELALAKIALVGEELGELCSAVRKPGPSEHIPEFSGEEEEVADAIIRLLDFAAWRNLRVDEAIAAKILFNANRPYKHGKLA